MHLPTQADYEEKLAAEEQHKLLSMVTALSKANREEVYRKGVELLEEQNSNESADCLPTVVISGVCVCVCVCVNVQVYRYHYHYMYMYLYRLKIFAWFCCV